MQEAMAENTSCSSICSTFVTQWQAQREYSHPFQPQNTPRTRPWACPAPPPEAATNFWTAAPILLLTPK